MIRYENVVQDDDAVLIIDTDDLLSVCISLDKRSEEEFATTSIDIIQAKTLIAQLQAWVHERERHQS